MRTMLAFILYYSKVTYTVSDTHVLLGHPKCTSLQPFELNCLQQAGIDISGTEQYLMYPKIFILNKDRTVMSRACSRSVKRNDSCITFSDGGETFHGIVQRIVLNTVTEKCHAIVHKLKPAATQLCQDLITNAKLNDHLFSVYPTRYTVHKV